MKNLWAGRIVSVADALARLGFPLSLSVELGIVELICVALYVIPRTSILGAISLTGYLDGAFSDADWRASLGWTLFAGPPPARSHSRDNSNSLCQNRLPTEPRA
jgi:hypothetical protein